MAKQQKLSVQTTRKRLLAVAKEIEDLAVRGAFDGTNGFMFFYDASFAENLKTVDDVAFTMNCGTPLALCAVVELKEMAMRNGEFPLSPFYTAIERVPVGEEQEDVHE